MVEVDVEVDAVFGVGLELEALVAVVVAAVAAVEVAEAVPGSVFAGELSLVSTWLVLQP